VRYSRTDTPSRVGRQALSAAPQSHRPVMPALRYPGCGMAILLRVTRPPRCQRARRCPRLGRATFGSACPYQTLSKFRVRCLACAMFQGPPFNPGAMSNRAPRTRDGRNTLARLKQWHHLFTECAAMIQFSLPVNRSCLNDRCKRQQHHCGKYFLHVSSRVAGGFRRSAKVLFSNPHAGSALQMPYDPNAAEHAQTRTECLICRSIAIAPSVYLPWQQY
jgi:hypothetical protein